MVNNSQSRFSKLRPFTRRLSFKLGLSILIMAVTIFVAALGSALIQSQRILRIEAMDRANSVLNTTVERVNRFIITIETATNVNDWLVRKNLQPDSLLAYSHRIVRFNPNVNGCSITTEPNTFPEYGRYFSAYSVRVGDTVITVREAEYEYFEKVWYKMPKQLGKPCWTEPFDDYNEGTLYTTELIASYCKPLYRDNGSMIGVISTDLSMKRLAEVIAKEHPYPHSYFMLIGDDGHYFVHPDTTLLFDKTIFSDTDPRSQKDIIALGHEMTAGKRGNMKVNFDGNPCLVCYQPVPGTTWSLALVCPDSDILYSYHRLAWLIIPLIIFGLIGILLLCHKAVSHAIRPLNQLVKQTQYIADGHFDEQIPHTRRADVVGRLQNSFATMQESLAVHVGNISKAIEETERRNQELIEATKLAEESERQKTIFTQNMTHQIRTPLNIIMGFAQVIRDNCGKLSEEEMKSISDMMVHNASLLSRMVLMLFDSSDTGASQEKSRPRNELVSCNELVRECIAYTYLYFPELPIDFVTLVPDALSIHTNSLYLMRSIRELLYNAAKYSDGKNISVHVSQTGATVRFVIQDTGPGMDNDCRDLMFKPFTKVNDLSEGLGLGLPLTKQHIVNLGGDLTLDTTYHDGCRFIIELPAY